MPSAPPQKRVCNTSLEVQHMQMDETNGNKNNTYNGWPYKLLGLFGWVIGTGNKG